MEAEGKACSQDREKVKVFFHREGGEMFFFGVSLAVRSLSLTEYGVEVGQGMRSGDNMATKPKINYLP